MSQENVEVVRELWDAYSRGDFDHVLALSDPYVVMVSLEEGPLCGADAVRENYERWQEAWEEPETAVEEVIGTGDQVVVMARFQGRGRSSGVTVEQRLYEVYTLATARSFVSTGSANESMPSKPPGCRSRRCRGERSARGTRFRSGATVIAAPRGPAAPASQAAVGSRCSVPSARCR
jgi:ketosteroid isomerase-like protein